MPPPRIPPAPNIRPAHKDFSIPQDLVRGKPQSSTHITAVMDNIRMNELIGECNTHPRFSDAIPAPQEGPKYNVGT